MENLTSVIDVVSTTNRTLKTTPEFPRYIQVTSTIFYVFIFLLGILGNLLVIVVVCMNRNMKTSVNIYLMNLCVADLLVLIVCMPTALADVYARDVWYFGSLMCKYEARIWIFKSTKSECFFWNIYINVSHTTKHVCLKPSFCLKKSWRQKQTDNVSTESYT